jgi:hypothetical protein
MNRRLPINRPSLLNRQALLFAAVLSLVIVIACAGCSDLPIDDFGPNSGGANAKTPTPTPNWVEEATPIRTPPPAVTASPTPELTESEPLYTPPVYAEIYSKNIYLLYNITALNYDLRIPSMIIDLDIEPEMYLNTKTVYSSYGSKGKISITESYPIPHADLVITIIDRKTGDVVEEHDFAQFTKKLEKHTITIRNPGSYQLEITGNNVNMGISISVPEENIRDGNGCVSQC